jgi:hypothetical protein
VINLGGSCQAFTRRSISDLRRVRCLRLKLL